jgi:hypothetical protein
MGNQLVNSMVRGFGLTLGRKAANAVTAPRQKTTTPEPVNFSKKQLELIEQNEKIKSGVVKILEDTEMYFKNGKITEGEYNILKSQANEQLVEVNAEIAKLKSVSPASDGPAWWKIILGWGAFIYAIIWCLKLIGKL